MLTTIERRIASFQAEAGGSSRNGVLIGRNSKLFKTCTAMAQRRRPISIVVECCQEVSLQICSLSGAWSALIGAKLRGHIFHDVMHEFSPQIGQHVKLIVIEGRFHNVPCRLSVSRWLLLHKDSWPRFRNW